MDGRTPAENTESRCFLDTAYTRLLLPALRRQVQQHAWILQQRGGALQGVNPRELGDCGDPRKLLAVVMRTGTFSREQVNLAFRLKQNRDILEKEEIIEDSVKTEVYEGVKALLETFPNTTEDLENLEGAWSYGISSLLKCDKSEKDKEIEEMRNQLENKERENEALRKRLESVKVQMQQIKTQEESGSDFGSSEGNSVEDDFYYSEDEDEVEKEAITDEFSLFSNNHGFGLASYTYKTPQVEVSLRATTPPSSLSSQISTLQYVDNSQMAPVAKAQNHASASNKSVSNKTPARPAPKAKPEATSAAPKPFSFATMASKAPVVPKPQVILKPSQPVEKPTPATASAMSTATEIGYKLNYASPRPDPRFKSDVQLMMGPLPGHLSHEVAYMEMRNIFASRGRVRFMYLSPCFIDISGKSVKYGYVAFEEKNDAQRTLKEGSVILMKKFKIKFEKMGK